MSNVTIDGIEYEPVNKSDKTRIVIAQRGWVFVGRYTENGDEVILRDASVVRVWGTTKGLGELAMNGPTSKTVLDAAGRVTMHRLAVVATLDCEAAKWK